MNFFTHIAISKIIYHNFKDRLYLRKRAFIYGNIKPDLTWGVMRNPHTWDNYFINPYLHGDANGLYSKP